MDGADSLVGMTDSTLPTISVRLQYCPTFTCTTPPHSAKGSWGWGSDRITRRQPCAASKPANLGPTLVAIALFIGNLSLMKGY